MMKSSKTYTGFAIALAWPQTYCKQPGAWYDSITMMLGVNENNYYKVGHAALVLIDKAKSKAYYFDFGRYHSPYQHGRVRSAETDHDLEIKTIPQFSQDGQSIVNFKALLHELQSNAACHGEGELHASYCQIDVEKALSKVHQMQGLGAIPYGPFRYQGSNCSRFVNASILAGKPEFKYRWKLKYRVPLTPTPLNNTTSLDNYRVFPQLLTDKTFLPIKKLNKQVLVSTLPQPSRHPNIPKEAHWLSGEGAGSWFVVAFEENVLKVTRYSPQGRVECDGIYQNNEAVEILKHQPTYSLTYPSNCKMISLNLNNSNIQFYRAS